MINVKRKSISIHTTSGAFARYRITSAGYKSGGCKGICYLCFNDFNDNIIY